MFTDAPGEWFNQWSRVPDAPSSVGARWVIERADALLLLVDSGALADRGRLPATRRATRDLMERVGASAVCPTAVVGTKDDISVPDAVLEAIGKASSEFLPKATLMKTTTKMPETIEACLSWAIEAATAKRPTGLKAEPSLSNDPFLALRRARGRS